jgi:predicted O-methyltransferase YrrM
MVITFVFLMNKHWSFKDPAYSRQQVVRYSLVITFDYFFSVFAMYLFSRILNFDYRLVRLGSIAVAVSWNFFLYKYWVYAAVKAQYPSPYEKIKNLGGWLTAGEAELLYLLSQKTKGLGRIVEIGSWKGRSTICLAEGAKIAGQEKIIAIDPHKGSSEHQQEEIKADTFAEFTKNIAEASVADYVEPKVMTSKEAAVSFSDPVELCFIDGAHEYEFVKEDCDLWFPKIINGGIIAFHDTISWPGPKKVVEENIFKAPNIRKAGFVDSISYGTKVEKNNFFDRARNRYILFLKNFFEVARKIKKRFNFLTPLTPLARKIFQQFQ